ncbi:unnamed protein product [Dovyalis caffra]|uniref:Uncharacterized protein n=1 Tax=Dovyalis caffra TaxID=77055 RepID=A0AAV1SQ60_9ROSI|nr:unnamed protein product [Dovyalis caffra]
MATRRKQYQGLLQQWFIEQYQGLLQQWSVEVSGDMKNEEDGLVSKDEAVGCGLGEARMMVLGRNGLMAGATAVIVGEWLDELTRLAWVLVFGSRVSRFRKASLLKVRAWLWRSNGFGGWVGGAGNGATTTATVEFCRSEDGQLGCLSHVMVKARGGDFDH